MDEVANYKLACTAAEAMVADYHGGYPPFVHADCAVPLVPCNTEGEPLVDDVPPPEVDGGSVKLLAIDLVKTCPQCGRETTVCVFIASNKWICDECYQPSGGYVAGDYQPEEELQ